MAKDASQYPVTWGYGEKLGNYTHRGEDRAMPVGVPIYVNGVLIGYSGNTGFSTGPHLHGQAGTDEWCQNTIKPSNYWWKGQVVQHVGEASQWGKYVIVRYKNLAGLTRYMCYAHLSRISVKKGQTLVSCKPKSTIFRVPWSEVLGRNFTNTHKGLYDKSIEQNVGNLDWPSWMNKLWMSAEAKAYRARREKALKYYADKPKHDAALKAKDTEIAALKKAHKAEVAAIQQAHSTEVKELKATIARLTKDLQTCQAESGSSSKWETFKALIRELLGIGNAK